jgi:hypothetical protein
VLEVDAGLAHRAILSDERVTRRSARRRPRLAGDRTADGHVRCAGRATASAGPCSGRKSVR